MVAILRFRTPVVHSELGTALRVDEGAAVELESVVPSSDRPLPFFWIYATDPEPIVDSLRGHESVERIEVVEQVDDATLVALEWTPDTDIVFHDIDASDGQILRAVCREGHWEFVVRFFEHEDLSRFRRRCERDEVTLQVERIYHGTELDEDPQFGVTDAQWEALALAVDRGYYDIPRRCSTADLADELGISSQAMTERLRRAVANLARHTVIAAQPMTDS